MVKENVKDFFKDRFSADVRHQVILDNVDFTSITLEDNNVLMDRIFEEEIKNAVCSKSLGPNGFNFGFIKYCWDVINTNVIRTVNNFEESARWLSG